jgi:murein L,D-transpeptidase YcbB/YkuD
MRHETETPAGRSVLVRALARGGIFLVAALLGVSFAAGAQSSGRAEVQGSVRSVDEGVLTRLYLSNNLDPVWTRGRKPTAQALDAITVMERAERMGLRSEDYETADLRAQSVALGAAADPAPAQAARFDVGMSASVLRLIAHLRLGRHDPRDFNSSVLERGEDEDLVAIAIRASRAEAVEAVIEAEEPLYSGYQELKSLLARYRRLATAEQPLPAFGEEVLRGGERHPGVPALRRLLVTLGDLQPGLEDGAGADVYSSELRDAVVAFQRRHGLDADGALGRSTIAALRVPLTTRVAQIESTMERWRWLPHNAPSRFIVVNIPGFTLRAFAGTEPVLTMPVIVGRAVANRRTPEFAGTIREVVAHPYWEVPTRIARNEVVPLIRQRAGYFEREGFEILGATGQPSSGSPTAETLAGVTAGRFRIRQRPGPANPLGVLKFVFPNRFSVYLHDTNMKGLFARSRRDFSHGCVRIADPRGLARFVLGADDEWSRDLDAILRTGATMHRFPRQPAEVFIMYTTAAADTGQVRFFPDIYGRDAALQRAFEAVAGAVAAGDEGNAAG